MQQMILGVFLVFLILYQHAEGSGRSPFGKESLKRKQDDSPPRESKKLVTYSGASSSSAHPGETSSEGDELAQAEREWNDSKKAEEYVRHLFSESRTDVEKKIYDAWLKELEKVTGEAYSKYRTVKLGEKWRGRKRETPEEIGLRLKRNYLVYTRNLDEDTTDPKKIERTWEIVSEIENLRRDIDKTFSVEINLQDFQVKFVLRNQMKYLDDCLHKARNDLFSLKLFGYTKDRERYDSAKEKKLLKESLEREGIITPINKIMKDLF